MSRPGGAGLTADAEHVVRGVGYGVAMKNLMYSEGFDDYSTARCRLEAVDGSPKVVLKFATSEVGQGFVTIAGQIARTILGVDEVAFDRIDTDIGSSGSTSASRQTWMSGGAVDAACRAVREDVFNVVGERIGVDPLRLVIDGTEIVDSMGQYREDVGAAIGDAVFDRTVEFHHRPTEELDEDGQGNCHTAFAFVAHRAVVDVDTDLGLVKVVQVATAQDVGRALNPLAVLGQIEGGISQGLGLAVMEEIVQIDGRIRNASFTDYLLPTMLDMPPVVATLIEEPDPQAPLGAKGAGEPPCISVTPAIAGRDPRRPAPGRRQLPTAPTASPGSPSAPRTSPAPRSVSQAGKVSARSGQPLFPVMTSASYAHATPVEPHDRADLDEFLDDLEHLARGAWWRTNRGR